MPSATDSVRVPSLRTDSVGVTWHGGSTPGRSIPISHFYIAHAGFDTAATINAQLANGKDLLFTPGVYELTIDSRDSPNTVGDGAAASPP